MGIRKEFLRRVDEKGVVKICTMINQMSRKVEYFKHAKNHFQKKQTEIS